MWALGVFLMSTCLISHGRLLKNPGSLNSCFSSALLTTPLIEYPRDYQAARLQIPASLRPKLRINQDTARRSFLSFQYANDALGHFIAKVKASRLAEETVIAITGDHNTWGLFDYKPENLHWDLAVPFVLYLPPQLSKKIRMKKPRGFGSHDDIFPTLMPLLLPEASYLQLGHNLLAPQGIYSFALNSSGWALDEGGAVSFKGQPAFYKWASPKRQKLLPSPPQAELLKLRKRAQARKVIMNYALRTELSKAFEK